MNYFQNLSPLNQVVVLIAIIGILFGFLVIYLYNKNNYELTRDWQIKT
tara:strand:+ start:193 stop:336 length:144 start_codon:yes stop_codon:yes gene_type:complete